MLSIIIFFPALAALFGLLVEEKSIKIYGVCVAFIEFLLTLVLWASFDTQIGQMQFVAQIWLVKLFGISYLVGVDGISLFLVIVSALMSFVSLFALNLRHNLKQLVIAILLLEMAMMGVLLSLDLMLFYIFGELSLLPLLYIIGAWGEDKRVYAAVKFFIYAFFGSVFLLLGIIALGYLHFKATGIWSFSLFDLQKIAIGKDLQIWLFFAFFIGFGVKVPFFPFHTWLPYAYGQAPTIGAVLLAAKMGTYGFIRFSLPLFVDASVWAFDFICILAVIMVIYTALIAFVQNDMKQIVAYSSISHMGIIMLGIFAFNATGMSGAVFLMVSHTLLSGLLFLLVGAIYERRGSRKISDFGGLVSVMPKFSIIFAITTLGVISLPLTIGFVGEFLSLLGIFKVSFLYAFLGGMSSIVTAIYMLHLFRKVFFGECVGENLALKDLSLKEIFAFVPICGLIIYLGTFPNLLLKPIDTSVKHNIEIMQKRSTQSQTVEFIKNSNGVTND